MMFDHHNREEAESMGEASVMGTFLLVAIGLVVVAFVIYIVAAVRLDRSLRKK
jgi:hypothetical protein